MTDTNGQYGAPLSPVSWDNDHTAATRSHAELALRVKQPALQRLRLLRPRCRMLLTSSDTLCVGKGSGCLLRWCSREGQLLHVVRSYCAEFIDEVKLLPLSP